MVTVAGPGVSVRRLAAGVIIAVVVAIAFVTAIGRLAGFGDVREVLVGGSFGWLALCVVGQVVDFAGYAGVLRTAVASEGGPDIPVGTSLRIVLASFAATQLFAFGGAGGLALVYWVLRRHGRDRRDAAVTLVGLTTSVYLVFALLGWAAAVLALVTAAAPLPVTVPWTVGVPVVLAAARWFTAPDRHPRWTADPVGRRWELFGTGVGAAVWVRRRLGKGRTPELFGWALAYWLGDLLSLWAALRAFGGSPGVVALTTAYATGYLVQSLPVPFVATAGVDTATTLLLHVVGVPLEVALLGVVAHRVFAFWLPVIPGAVSALTLPGHLPATDPGR